MLTIDITIPGNPPRVTAQHKGIGRTKSGKAYVFTKDRNVETKKMLLDAVAPYAPAEPLPGAVRLRVTYNFKAQRKKQWGTHKTTRPDGDNMIKLLNDVLTEAGYWNDDAQVSDLRVIRKWEAEGSTEIHIEELEE